MSAGVPLQATVRASSWWVRSGCVLPGMSLSPTCGVHTFPDDASTPLLTAGGGGGAFPLGVAETHQGNRGARGSRLLPGVAGVSEAQSCEGSKGRRVSSWAGSSSQEKKKKSLIRPGLCSPTPEP